MSGSRKPTKGESLHGCPGDLRPETVNLAGEPGEGDNVQGSTAAETAGYATHPREVDPLTVTKRLQAEGRWAGQIEQERNEMMRLARKRGMSKLDAQEWVYSELDRLYPPEAVVEINRTLSGSSSSATSTTDGGQIQGLGDIPASWPELPANASLAVEVAGVQANRLRVVAEHAGGATVVNLTQSLTPAPSWAALGWLETSIRSYAKYVDVAARATAVVDGEAGVWRREGVAIEEVRTLLDEMLGPGE